MGMALQLKGRTRRNWRLPLTTGAVVLGIGLLAFKTFPHLKDSLSQYPTGEDTTEDDNEPIEVEPVDRKESEAQTPTSSSLKDTEHSDVSQWNENEMKGWLHEKEISPPADATRRDLASLIKSIQENSR